MTIENQTLHIPTQNSYSNGTSGSYCTPCCFQTQRNFSAMAPILRRKCQFPGCSWSHNSRDRGTNHLSKFFFSLLEYSFCLHQAMLWSRSNLDLLRFRLPAPITTKNAVLKTKVNNFSFKSVPIYSFNCV